MLSQPRKQIIAMDILAAYLAKDNQAINFVR